ncbi:hypothetical protein, partial [Nocardioides sp.]|uniref:hypothetical protein n=1 Tax=Nocardioides sp. TaxID=35761 RepID=UPI002733D7A6
AVPLDRLLLGGQNRLGATAFAEAVGDDSWPLTRVVDGPHVDLLLACAERELSDEEILRSRYGQMALACISSGGQFFSATDGPGVVAIARRFVAHTRRGMQSAPGDTAVPHQSRPGHPALVVPVRGTDCFQLIDGHHRVAGLWVLGQREVEAKVKRLPVALPRRAPEPVTGSRATSRAS